MTDLANLLNQFRAEVDKRTPIARGTSRFLKITKAAGRHPQMHTYGCQDVPPPEGCVTFLMDLTAGTDDSEPEPNAQRQRSTFRGLTEP